VRGGVREGGVPNGHKGPYYRRLAIGDCEIRNLEAFSVLTTPLQKMVLTAIEAGEGPAYLYPIFLRLRDYGVLICS